VTARSLPPRPHLNQLKRQAKELLRREPDLGRLREAQRRIAEEYGFASWDALRKHVESLVGAVSSSIIKPPELDSDEGVVVWNALTASHDGDVDTLRRLLERDMGLSRAEYWYTPAIHFAVREGQVDAVQVLLDAGADPEWNGLHDGSLIVMARDRDMARWHGSWKNRGIAAGASCPDQTTIRFMSRSLAKIQRKSAGCSTPIQASWTSVTKWEHRRSIERSDVV
jgi:hypothetical protein